MYTIDLSTITIVNYIHSNTLASGLYIPASALKEGARDIKTLGRFMTDMADGLPFVLSTEESMPDGIQVKVAAVQSTLKIQCVDNDCGVLSVTNCVVLVSQDDGFENRSQHCSGLKLIGRVTDKQ